MTHLGRRGGWLALALLAGAISAASVLGSDPYTGIPPGHGFPADEATLGRSRATQDVSALRRHGWTLWSAINQPAPSGGPLWETWFPSSQVFSQQPTPEGAAEPARPRFTRPRQHSILPGVEEAGQSLLSFVLFNKEAMDHVRSNAYHRRATLTALNTSFNQGSTPTKDRHIKPFPREAVALKVAWDHIPKQGLKAMPIWDFDPAGAPGTANAPGSWKRSIAVDPSRTEIPPGETATLQVPAPGGGTQPRVCRVVPLSSFYHFKISDEAQRANAQDVLGTPVQIGDFVALIAMHVTTKEIGDWAWATFWWHDEPNRGPFALDRTPEVAGVWRNYLLDVSFDGTTPREFDGSPNAVMNPWLEARFTNGLASNCMTCHQRATQAPQSFLPITRGMLAPDNPYFQDKTTTDFLWSVALEPE